MPPLILDEDNNDGTNEQSDFNHETSEPVKNNANSYNLLRKRNVEKGKELYYLFILATFTIIISKHKLNETKC